MHQVIINFQWILVSLILRMTNLLNIDFVNAFIYLSIFLFIHALYILIDAQGHCDHVYSDRRTMLVSQEKTWFMVAFMIGKNKTVIC